MQTSIEQKEGYKIALNIEVEEEKVNTVFNKIYKELAKTTTVAGFRKGKVPKVVLNSIIGKDIITQSVQEELIKEVYPQALEKEKLKPLSEPEFKDLPLPEENKSYKFNVILEVRPQIEIDNYKGLELIKKKSELTEEKINERLSLLREIQAILKPVEDRGFQENDVIDMEVKLKDDEEFEEKLEKYIRTKGFGSEFYKEFMKKLYGLRIDEEKEILLKLPHDFQDEKYQDKEVEIIVKIKEIKEKILPEIDDELAKSFHYENLDALKEDIKRKLEVEIKEDINKDLENQVIDKLISKVNFDSLPEGLLKTEREHVLRRLEYDLKYYGLDKKDYIEGNRLKNEKEEEKLKSIVERKVKSDIILLNIADKENIEISDEELDKEITAFAVISRKNKEVLKRELEDKQAINSLKDAMKISKTLKFIIDNANIKE